MCKCPQCKSNFVKRISRNFWQKRIPSKLFKCYECRTEFLKITIFDITFVTKEGNESAREVLQ